MPSYPDTHRVLSDDWSYRRNDNENDEDVREIAFRQIPDFESSELYSLTDHSKDTQPPVRLSNGSVKTHLSILVNNVNQSLNSIDEEASSPTDVTGVLLSPENGTCVNGIHELKRKSLLRLNGDLTSESTDEEQPDDTKFADVEKQVAKDGPDSLMTNVTESPQRNHASIRVSSPSHTNDNLEPINDSEDLYNGDIQTRFHEVQVDIPLTPSMRSSVSNTSDDISSLSSNSSRTSPLTISSATLLMKQTSKQVVPVSGDDNSLTTDTENSSKDKRNETHAGDTKTNDTITTETPTEEIQTNGTDVCDGNKLQISTSDINKDHNLQNGSLPSAITANSVIKMFPFKQSRRRSSGYIPYNGDIHQNIHIPECIIRDDITLSVDQATDDDKSCGNSHEEITSRTDACDHALKTFYSLKTKLNTLNHSNRPVRTNNEILGNKKQSMIQGIDVLEECNEQIKDLTTSDENVVEAVLRTRSSLSQLTESCTLLYNAEYSMKHFTSELIESIDKHIDVLITTDAWNTTRVSDLTIELHKDKCELVRDSLESLRKIINKL